MKRKNWVMAVAAAGAVMAMGVNAQAALLGIAKGYPDITSSFVNLSYNATAVSAKKGRLTFTGTPTSIKQTAVASSVNFLAGGTFSFGVDVDWTNTASPVFSNAALSIQGSTAGPSVNQLTSTTTVVGFGFNGVASVFDAVLVEQSGVLGAPGFGIGTILSGSSITAFNGQFNANFSKTNWGQADTWVIPEPTALAPLATGGLLLARRRRPVA